MDEFINISAKDYSIRVCELKAVKVGKSTGPGGRGGIRTHGGVSPTAVFKTAALNHSATLPASGSRRRVLPV